MNGSMRQAHKPQVVNYGLRGGAISQLTLRVLIRRMCRSSKHGGEKCCCCASACWGSRPPRLLADSYAWRYRDLFCQSVVGFAISFVRVSWHNRRRGFHCTTDIQSTAGRQVHASFVEHPSFPLRVCMPPLCAHDFFLLQKLG